MKKLLKQLQLEEDLDVGKLINLNPNSNNFYLILLKLKTLIVQLSSAIMDLTYQIEQFELDYISNLRKEASKTGFFEINGVKTKLTEAALNKMPYKYESEWQQLTMEVMSKRFEANIISAIVNILEKKYNAIFNRLNKDND